MGMAHAEVFIAEENFLSEGKYASSSHHPFVLMFIILKSDSVACQNAHRYSQKCCFLWSSLAFLGALFLLLHISKL
jgi:hypothetical protein